MHYGIWPHLSHLKTEIPCFENNAIKTFDTNNPNKQLHDPSSTEYKKNHSQTIKNTVNTLDMLFITHIPLLLVLDFRNVCQDGDSELKTPFSLHAIKTGHFLYNENAYQLHAIKCTSTQWTNSHTPVTRLLETLIELVAIQNIFLQYECENT